MTLERLKHWSDTEWTGEARIAAAKALDWIEPDRTRLDWCGLEWAGLDLRAMAARFFAVRLNKSLT